MEIVHKQCYGVQKHSFDNKTSEILALYTDKREATNQLECIAFHFIQDKDGDNKLSSIADVKKCLYQDKEFETKKDTLPIGHYVTRNPMEDLYKLTVWQKKEIIVVTPGRLYGKHKTPTLVVEKLFSITLVLVPIQEVRKMKLNCLRVSDCETDDDDEEAISNHQYFVDSFIKTQTFKRLQRNGEHSKDASVAKIRNDFPYEFTKCILAKKHADDGRKPQHDDMVKEMKEKHKEIERKRKESDPESVDTSDEKDLKTNDLKAKDK